MYRKLVGVGLLICLILLAGCTPVPAEQVNSAPPPAEATVEPFPTLTPAAAFLAGCTNVRSVEFNMGAAVDTRICLEGTVNTVTVSKQDNRAAIEFDTSSGKYGGSLYSLTIIIPDSNAFGVDNLNQLVKGERIAVNGLFSKANSLTYVAAFVIEISQPDQLVVLG